jgi:hypothetical protein
LSRFRQFKAPLGSPLARRLSTTFKPYNIGRSRFRGL